MKIGQNQVIIFVLFFAIVPNLLPLLLANSDPLIRLPTEENTPVINIDGNPVIGGPSYRVIPTTFLDVPGYLSSDNAADGDSSTCDVVLNSSSSGQLRPTGRRVRIFPFEGYTVIEGKPVNVVFDEAPGFPCPEQTAWKLDSINGQTVVRTGGVQFDESETSSVFTIVKNRNGMGYDFTSVSSSRIGVVGNNNQLGITNYVPFGFYFVLQ